MKWGAVRLSCESCEAQFMDIGSKGVNAVNENVDSQVEFESIDEKRLVNVSLDNVVLSSLEALKGSNQENAPSLAASFRFDDEGFGLFLREKLGE